MADLMNHRGRSQALVLLLGGLAGAAAAVEAREVQCQRGDLLRRVELRGDATPGAPCEVVYWKDSEAPGVARVLWQAKRDRSFCESKASELVERLSAAGWTCTPAALLSPAAIQAQAHQPSESPAEPPAAAPPLPALKPAASGEPSPAGPDGARSSAATGSPDLAQIVAQTLASVRQLYGGDFEAATVERGDLDGDGLDDATVLITYQATREEDAIQYLVAYRFDGRTFRSVATKKVSGRFLDAVRAEVEGIAGGAVLVELQERDGDACCQTRATAYVLRDGRLVEVDRAATASATQE